MDHEEAVRVAKEQLATAEIEWRRLAQVANDAREEARRQSEIVMQRQRELDVALNEALKAKGIDPQALWR